MRQQFAASIFKSKTVVEVYDTKPEGIVFEVQVAACYLEIDNRLLLMQRSKSKSDPGKWGVPAGRVEKNETPENAAKRELQEETGISFEKASQIQHLTSLYIRKPEVDYIYHLFKVQLVDLPDIQLSEEHQNYRWAAAKDIEELFLMDGAKEAIYRYEAIKNRSRYTSLNDRF